MFKYKIITGENPDVSKYIFEKPDAITESVLYKYPTYEERTVLCCSTQSGCPVGCEFCGTGKKFIRNLSYSEIVEQVKTVFNDIQLDTNKCKRLQIMFMSMGEPMLNWMNTQRAIKILNGEYPNAELLLSTVGIKDYEVMRDLIKLSIERPKVGLQFSLHESTDFERNKLIPFKNKLSIRELRNFGIEWHKATNRPVFINYCVTANNSTMPDVDILMDLFPPNVFNFTFSVVCTSSPEQSKIDCSKEMQVMTQEFIKEGYNVRQFNPAGQDDIGGGCGQLWYVQDWMKNYKQET